LQGGGLLRLFYAESGKKGTRDIATAGRGVPTIGAANRGGCREKGYISEVGEKEKSGGK